MNSGSLHQLLLRGWSWPLLPYTMSSCFQSSSQTWVIVSMSSKTYRFWRMDKFPFKDPSVRKPRLHEHWEYEAVGLVGIPLPFSTYLEFTGIWKMARPYNLLKHETVGLIVIRLPSILYPELRGLSWGDQLPQILPDYILILQTCNHPDTLFPAVFLKLLGLAKFLRLKSLCVPDTSRSISVAENATSCSVPYTKSHRGTTMFLTLHFLKCSWEYH